MGGYEIVMDVFNFDGDWEEQISERLQVVNTVGNLPTNVVDHEYPFIEQSGATNPIVEAGMLQAYIGLAVLVECLQSAIENERPLEPDEMESVHGSIAFTLHIFESLGLVKRHPKLAEMPMDIPPTDFLRESERDTEEDVWKRRAEWVAGEVVDLVSRERARMKSLFN